MTMEDVELHFGGPFTLSAGPRSLFHSCVANTSGVYLWTFRQRSDGSHLIHYVGETISLAKRHKEHLTHMLGMNYGVFDPDKAEQGVSAILWPGMWRDKSVDGPSKCLDAYGELNETVRRYVAALNVFFAPTSLPDQLRKHVEGCVGWNLRNRHPEHKVLYPDDNHIGTRADKTNGMLRVSSSERIRGLDELIPY